MTRLILALALIVASAGCESLRTPLDDGYQFGDLSRTVYGGAAHIAALRTAYCQSGDPLVRRGLLLSIHAVAPNYPEDGVCTDLLETLSDASRDPAAAVD